MTTLLTSGGASTSVIGFIERFISTLTKWSFLFIYLFVSFFSRRELVIRSVVSIIPRI